jgi:hypothetical protein
MLEYWPYATLKKTNFDIYIYMCVCVCVCVCLPQLRRKTEYSKYESGIYFFNIKKNSGAQHL